MRLFDRNAGHAELLARARLLLLSLCMVSLAACSTVYRNHGYVPTDADLALLEVGVDTRETVAEKVGRPLASGLLNDVGWYYVQSRWAYRGALEPREVDRQVVAISFTEAGRVQNVERFGLERGRVVPLSRRVTESNVRGLTVIQQLLGNFGRLGPGVVGAD